MQSTKLNTNTKIEPEIHLMTPRYQSYQMMFSHVFYRQDINVYFSETIKCSS